MKRRGAAKLSVRELFSLCCILAGLSVWIASPARSSKASATIAPQSTPLSQRVLVVYDQASPQSLEVANYYIGKRGIPASNKCAVNSAQTTHIPDWNAYDSIIKTPIRNCLNALGRDQILYIVFSYQTPYKVGSSVKSIDQQVADIWDEYSQNTFSAGQHAYFAEAQSQGNVYQPFVSLADYRQQPASQHLYSVWRLDAASVELAKGLVDKALLAEANGLTGRGCFDIRGEADGFNDYVYGSGDWDIHRSADFSRLAGFPVTEDFHSEEFGTQPAPLRCDDAALYAGWYSLNNYNDAFTWKPGAIGLHTDSLSAYDVRGGTNWSANALIKGITVTSGAIDEPYLGGVAHPDGVFRNLFEGANVGDALLRNTEYLKWMIVNVGDPLYRPFPGGRAPFNSTNTAQARLALNPLPVGGGSPSLATLTLPAPAASGGAQVTLASNNPSVASVPSIITVPAGATQASFNINTSPVSGELVARITASYPGGAISNTLIIQPNRPPVIELTNPLDGQAFTAPASITLNATASDSDGQISRVDFYAGATLIGTDSTSPYSVTWNNVAAGNYTLTATATDSAGTTSSSGLVHLTVNPAQTPQTPLQ
ncbi:MAG TPA: TIGR03790 family protein, partial [Pyrinomonadaceae bacterium]